MRAMVYGMGSQRDYQKALADFETAIKYAPMEAENYNRRGLVLDEMGDFENAISSFDAALS